MKGCRGRLRGQSAQGFKLFSDISGTLNCQTLPCPPNLQLRESQTEGKPALGTVSRVWQPCLVAGFVQPSGHLEASGFSPMGEVCSRCSLPGAPGSVPPTCWEHRAPFLPQTPLDGFWACPGGHGGCWNLSPGPEAGMQGHQCGLWSCPATCAPPLAGCDRD